MNGPDREFRALYEELAPGIRRYLSRLVGAAEAEDLTQEVFARAHRALPTRRGDSLVSTWLYRIATNAAIDRLRAASRHEVPVAATAESPVEEEHELVSGGGACEAQDADSHVIRKEMRHCILDLVDRLPPAYREVILLGELRDSRDQEIADALGITLEAAKMRLHRARAELRKLLGASCELYRDERNELACDRKPPGGSRR
ncbi:RNA polymerase sigma factor [Anaeromyxobacter oryzae]|uniref:DNA-directed RNA polymerase sigma-70 factor n=1 Tax=Anaeromyxobacter oryzae TaxID=2918170 RepID=A0ABN6MMY4_9BACT|nr:RNA polymerase sigma factor [Anaeromyxobacter oryzae]BDG02376.1 DNA-directed RNA polymerase sigma-70 factor [Anaeromyxobacter oryzae]